MIVSSGEPFIGYVGLKEFRAHKAELHKLTGSDDAYYAVLKRFNLEHADQIKTTAVERDAKQALAVEMNHYRWEGGEAIDASPVRKRPARKMFAFEWGEQVEEIKRHLNWLTGNDRLFDAILLRHGFNDIGAIKDRAAAYPALKELSAMRNLIQMEHGMGPCDQELRTTLERALRILDGRFWSILGRDYAVATVDQAMALPSDHLRELLKRLKQEVDEFVPKEET